MEKNMRLNPDLLRICKKHLSPFGQKVFFTLIKLKNENQNKMNNLSESKPCNYQNKRLIKFNDFNVPITPTIINDTNIENSSINGDNLPTISRSIDLLKTTEFKEANIINKTNEGVNGIEIDNVFALTFQEIGSNHITNKIHDEKETSTAVTWDDMFDSDLLNDIIDSNDKINNTLNKTAVDQTFNISNVEQKLDPVPEIDEKKNTLKSSEPLKKIKTSGIKKVKPKNVYRKDKYTTTVKNWLNNVDANNEDEVDILARIHHTQINRDISKAKISNETEPKKDENVSQITLKPKSNKKTIQAQLANKDGVMKFKKPKKNVEVYKTTEIFEGIDNNKDIENITKAKTQKNHVPTKINKEKKVAKFVAPIKSQLPVKDLTFAITVVNDNNFKEHKNKLQLISDSEVVTILMYRNGFSQLNSQHTDDSCIPEGVLLHFNDTFYYLEGKINGFAEILRIFFIAKTLICYEAKDLIIYMRCLFELSFTVCNITDVKIGSHLINPDKPPENFSDVQKLLEFIPDFTIATECPLQKAAWYITLLKESSNKLRSMLIENGLWKVFVDIEMKILPIVAEMQDRGVSVDVDKLKKMQNILMNRINDIEAECYKAAGKTFQINSSVQVRTILYDELKLDTKSNVKIKETICKGAKSTAESMLRCLTSVHPLPKLILEYRHLHKAHATFLAGIAQHVKDGVIKPTWDQTAAATGRIASNNPNLQAIPKAPFNLVLFPKDDDGSGSKDQTLDFRSVYIPRNGYTLLAADFKHVECRVFAQHAQDTRLHDALRQHDIFRVLAAEWLKKPEANVTTEDRERTKRIVYASLYGAGTRKLMEILNLGYDQVLSIMSSFNRTFPSLKSFGRSVVSECEKRNGRLTIASGRARTFDNISSSSFTDKSHAERQAVNFIIQGTAADLCKTAMILTTKRLRQSDPPVDAHLLLQIHDELVWEVMEQDVNRAAEIIKHTMENCGLECGMDLTLAVAMYRGNSWGEMEEFTLNSFK